MRVLENGFVYFLLATNGCHKIGKARDPQQRIGSFRCLKYGLTLVHIIASNDAYWLESKFHAFFERVRVKGEWFQLSEEDVAAIKEMQRCDRFSKAEAFGPFPSLPSETKKHATALGALGGNKGGFARAAVLSPERRREIAIQGAKARWKGKGISWPPPCKESPIDGKMAQELPKPGESHGEEEG